MMTETLPPTFREFLLEEIKKRSVTPRQFALRLGVDPSTLTRLMDERSPSQPSIEFLLKLGAETGYSVTTLISLAYPDVAQTDHIPASTMLIAERIEQLPEDLRNTILFILRTAPSN